MGRAVSRMYHSRTALVLAIGWLFAWLFLNLWPAYYWFEVRSFRINDGYAGEPVLMDVERVIYRDFYGTWSVVIRKRHQGGWAVYCPATGEQQYRTSAVQPEPLTLDWWTAGECPELSPGTYTLETTWTIYPPFPWPKKQVDIVSAPFHITEKAE